MVDFIRRPYRVLARPFKDSEETAEMVWYPALPDAPTLPFPTTFNSLEYQPFPLAKTSPGEVPFVDRHFIEQRAKRHATGEHQCGTPEAFLEGIPYDPAAHVEYNADGLPVCCVGWERGPCSCSKPGALVEVVPICVVPGDTCPCAIAVPFVFLIGYTISASGVWWYKTTVPSTGTVGAALYLYIWQVTADVYTGSCGSLTYRGTMSPNGEITFPVNAGDTIYYAVSRLTFNPTLFGIGFRMI